jgi:UDP-glucose 4-epimerase
LSPSFTTIDTDRESMREPSTYYMENEEPVIILKAMQAGGEIAASLFVSTKLRYLNLK